MSAISIFLMSCSVLFSPSEEGENASADAQRSQVCGEFLCQGNSFCNLGGDTPMCECLNGFEGPNCSVNIDECEPNPCRNEGSCTDEVNGFSCTCDPDWGGEICDEELCPPTNLSLTSLPGGCHSTVITAGAVSISSPNGDICIGGALGVDDGFVDGKNGDETVVFSFSQKVTDVSFGAQTVGNGDGNATLGEVTVGAYDGGTNLGSVIVGASGTYYLRNFFGLAEMNRVSVTGTTADTRSLSTLSYKLPCL